MLTAYLLVSHGSRDPRPQAAMEKLAELVRTQLEVQDAVWTPRFGDRQIPSEVIPGKSAQPRARLLKTPTPAYGVARSALMVSRNDSPLVETATLELAAPLHEQIYQFATVARAAGCKQVRLLPVFLLPGVHVKEDIPREVALAQKRLGEAIAIQQYPHLGSHPQLGKILTSQLAPIAAEAKILLAHGTRRTGGNEPVAVMAQQLGAVAAYWSVPPALEDQVAVLADAGQQRIAILPYFLFSGGIADAIAEAVARLQEQYSKLQLTLASPIGVSQELADLIVELAQTRASSQDEQPG